MSTRIQWSQDGSKGYVGSYTDGKKNALSTSVRERFDAEPGSASVVNPNDWAPNDSDYRYVIFNLPSPIVIEKVAFWSQTVLPFEIEVSSDTDSSETPGLTGTWVNIGNLTNLNSQYSISDPLTPISTQWLRLRRTSHWHYYIAAIHLFGTYDTPLTLLYDNAGTPAPITDPTYFNFSPARSNAEYAQTKTFRVHNDDTASHSYSVTLSPQNYAGVTFIDDHFTLSVDGGTTKLSALSTGVIAPGGNSVPIVIHADIPSIDNPGSGWYYPKVTIITET